MNLAPDLPAQAATEPQAPSKLFLLFEELKAILIPTALVTLVAQLFGATPTQTAAASLQVVLTVYLWLYRAHIARRVPAWALLVFISCVATTTYIFWQRLGVSRFNEKLQDSGLSSTMGIVGYQEKANDLLPRVRELLDTSTEEAWFVGTAFHVSAPQLKEQILERLQDGVTVRFLVYDLFDQRDGTKLNPNSQAVAESFGSTNDELITQAMTTYVSLVEIHRLAVAQGLGDRFQVRLSRDIPRSRLYVFDPEKETGHTFFVPYVDRRDSPNIPGFMLQNKRGGIYRTYVDEASRRWNVAEPLDVWMPRYEQYRSRYAANP